MNELQLHCNCAVGLQPVELSDVLCYVYVQF